MILNYNGEYWKLLKHFDGKIFATKDFCNKMYATFWSAKMLHTFFIKMILNAFKIDKGPKNTDQICCFNPFWRNFLFILSSGTVFGDFFLYILRFLDIFSIHVPMKKLEFKCDGSLYSIFCRFLQTFDYHKIWTLRRFFYKVKLFYMDCIVIVNKYIFFNLYVHSHLKYTHTYI